MPSILVTGANRGMGLEWVRQYSDLGWRVHASCRFPDQAEELHALAEACEQVSIVQLDVTDQRQIIAVADTLGDEPLDILVNNAGVYHEQWGRDRIGSINYDDWLATLNVNTLGAMRVTEALRHHLSRSDRRLMIAISSHMGSIADITTANDYAYRSSKAALNAAMKGLALELAPAGIGILLVHPGWVKTRMGGSGATYSVVESVGAMRHLAERFRLQDSGRFFRHDGVIIPW